jgi:hypothetical protein
MSRHIIAYLIISFNKNKKKFLTTDLQSKTL